MDNRIKKAIDIQEKVQKRWTELQKDFYVCYTVKELAYKIGGELINEYYGDNREIELYCKIVDGVAKIALLFENDIYLVFDIWLATGAFGDCGMHCGNAVMNGKFPEGFVYIEEILEDEEE
jgi:hypothetical protein